MDGNKNPVEVNDDTNVSDKDVSNKRKITTTLEATQGQILS